MQRPLCTLTLACSLFLPAWAQTQVWSEAPPTQRWSQAPQRPMQPAPPAPPAPAPRTPQWSTQHALPGAAPAARAPAAPDAAAGRTTQWSTPTYTQRRSDADIQRQVDAITRDAEHRARAGQGGWSGGRSASQVPDQAWRDHMDRSRAQDQFQRDQDDYYRRQREFSGR